jgi:hypothetical protein
MSKYDFAALLTMFAIGSIPGVLLINYSIKEKLLSLGITGWITSVIIGIACAIILEIPVGFPSVVIAGVFFGIIKYSKK